jgi:hypothetical protein
VPHFSFLFGKSQSVIGLCRGGCARFVHANETELFRNCISSSDFRSVAFSVEQTREATMRDPSLTDVQQTKSVPGTLGLFPDDYDDEDEADYDDSDDDENLAFVSRERWLSRPDFGSPEWWSRT